MAEARGKVAETDALIGECREVGVEVSPSQAREMLAWLGRVEAAPLNLSGIRERVEARRKHLVDSVSCLPLLGLRDGECCADVGSGGGFPGVPLAILRPGAQIRLVDSVGKKVRFLVGAVAAAGLCNVDATLGRAEVLGRDGAWRERLDCVVARAVAPLGVLVEYALPLCRVGGRFVALKGEGVRVEMGAAGRAVERLGGVISVERSLVLPGGGRRVLVRIDKIRHTPDGFPRGVGIPARRPL